MSGDVLHEYLVTIVNDFVDAKKYPALHRYTVAHQDYSAELAKEWGNTGFVGHVEKVELAKELE